MRAMQVDDFGIFCRELIYVKWASPTCRRIKCHDAAVLDDDGATEVVLVFHSMEDGVGEYRFHSILLNAHGASDGRNDKCSSNEDLHGQTAKGGW